MSLGTNLQFLRKMCKSMTQENLAEIMNVSRQTIAKWETDAAYPEIDKLMKLSDIFSCSIDRLLREDLNVTRDAYSQVRIEEVEEFKMVWYAVISPDPEGDSISHLKQWMENNNLLDEQIIGWDFPYVTQQQISVFHMHGYAAACILPDNFITEGIDMEIASQKRATYAVITVEDPFLAPFDLIPNAYKTINSYMEVNGLRNRSEEDILLCFEKVYEKDDKVYMNVYIAIDER